MMINYLRENEGKDLDVSFQNCCIFHVCLWPRDLELFFYAFFIFKYLPRYEQYLIAVAQGCQTYRGPGAL